MSYTDAAAPPSSEDASGAFGSDHEIAIQAVKTHGRAVMYASEALRSDLDFVLLLPPRHAPAGPVQPHKFGTR